MRDARQRPWVRWPAVEADRWREDIEPALRRVYESRTEGIGGEEQRAFGREFAAFCGSRYGILLSHGTDALAAALVATLDLDGIAPGGEVVIPNYTFVATASCAVHLGCPVCFVDIEPRRKEKPSDHTFVAARFDLQLEAPQRRASESR